MKAQLTVQYLASFVFFIGLILYIYFSYSANIPAFMEEVEKEDVRSKAFQLSEILVNDPGDPEDWWDEIKYPSPDSINRIGFSDESSNKPNLISMRKIMRFSTLCSDAQQKLALERPFSVHVFNVSQTTGERNLLAECVSPGFPTISINATVRRITALNNTETNELELAEVIVQM